MGLPKKKSRKIDVNEQQYRWLICHGTESLSLWVEGIEGTGQRLVVNFSYLDLDPTDDFAFRPIVNPAKERL